MERTLSIIKPDAVKKGKIGAIVQKFEENGLRPVALKKMRLSRDMAETFYAEHKERPFFGELVNFMMSGPVVVQVLEGDSAITRNRALMGATNPKNAEPGTIRYEFARDNDDLSANAVHGSDSPESASREISFFFKEDELVG